jgi:quinol monooxygenase YgiN
MSHHVEFVKFRVKDGERDAFLSVRPAAIEAVRAAHPLLVGAPVLAEHPDGSWTDVWIYQTAEAAAAANQQAGQIPAFVAMAGLLEDVAIEEATAPDTGTARD